MIKKIKYGNSVIQYDLFKSKRRKTSQITVTSEGVTVRTPQTKTTDDIKNMIQQRLQWIFKKQLEFKDRKKQRTKQYNLALNCLDILEVKKDLKRKTLLNFL